MTTPSDDDIIDLKGAHIDRLAVRIIEHMDSRRPYAIPLPGAATQGILVSRRVALLGYALVNSDGAAPHVFSLFDGASSGATPVSPGLIPASSSVREWFGPQGIECRAGLFQTSDTQVSGAVFIIPLD